MGLNEMLRRVEGALGNLPSRNPRWEERVEFWLVFLGLFSLPVIAVVLLVLAWLGWYEPTWEP